EFFVAVVPIYGFGRLGRDFKERLADIAILEGGNEMRIRHNAVVPVIQVRTACILRVGGSFEVADVGISTAVLCWRLRMPPDPFGVADIVEPFCVLFG